jgi:hypothetical protein
MLVHFNVEKGRYMIGNKATDAKYFYQLILNMFKSDRILNPACSEVWTVDYRMPAPERLPVRYKPLPNDVSYRDRPLYSTSAEVNILKRAGFNVSHDDVKKYESAPAQSKLALSDKKSAQTPVDRINAYKKTLESKVCC